MSFKAKKRYTDLRSKNEESGVRLEPSHDMDKENEPIPRTNRKDRAHNTDGKGSPGTGYRTQTNC